MSIELIIGLVALILSIIGIVLAIRNHREQKNLAMWQLKLEDARARWGDDYGGPLLDEVGKPIKIRRHATVNGVTAHATAKVHLPNISTDRGHRTKEQTEESSTRSDVDE